MQSLLMKRRLLSIASRYDPRTLSPLLLTYIPKKKQYMRNQRAGQATFIPLDTIQAKPINDKFRSFAKGARLAVDVIQYEPAVERAMHHACGNALVCDTMEVARYICYEKGQEVKGSFHRLIVRCPLTGRTFLSQLLPWRELSFTRVV